MDAFWGSLYGNAIGVNFGGGILPVAMSVYLLYRLRKKDTGWRFVFAPILVIGIGIVYGECKFIPESGVRCSSILLPTVIAGLVHASELTEPRIDLETKLIMGFACATLAYLIGGDFLFFTGVISSVTGHSYVLGGAGICDGIFLGGLYTVAVVMIIDILGNALADQLRIHT